MKFIRNLPVANVATLVVFLSFLSLLSPGISAQDTTKIALQRGYRTGYSDGYMAGYRDANENSSRNFAKHSEYSKASRMYSQAYGALEDYRDGYQQGFESGYNTGFEKRSFDAAFPSDLKRRGTTNPEPLPDANPSKPSGKAPPKINPKSTNLPPVSAPQSNEPIVIIPTDTELILELTEEINTQTAKTGDLIQAKIVSPYEITGAVVNGRISKIIRPGRLKRKAQLLLTFDRIHLSETRWSNFNAILTEIVPVKDDNVKEVDIEGAIKGKGTLKKDTITVGGATGTGAVVGAVVGGPVGAAVGAGVGAAFGVGAIVVDRGKHIRLGKGQQIKIKTTYETQIR